MPDQHLCSNGGWAVCASLAVPSDPAEHWDRFLPAVFGCSRIQCLSCGSPVRSQPRLAGTEDLRPHLGELYAATEWTGLPWVEPAGDVRLYACRCTAWLERSRRQLADPHPDPEFDVELPWECAGHPMPTLPLLVDGVEIDTDTDLAALADEVIASGAPDGALALYKDFPAAWLVRLYVRLHGLREADVLSRHLAARLVGGDPATRGAALVFWGCQARADGFDQILALGEALSCAEAARDYLTPHGSRHTATSLLASLTARLALSAHDENDLDRRTLALIRRYLLEPGFPGHRGFVASLVARDAEWLVRNAPGIAAASPRVLPLLLDGLVRADAEELVAVAGVAVVRSGDEAGRAALAAWLRAPANASAPWTEVLAPLLGR